MSRQDIFHDISVDIGKAEVSARVTVGQVFVIESHEVKNGSVEIMNMDLVFHGREAEFVGRTVGHTTFDSSAGEPNGKPVVIMITTTSAFRHRGATELASP